MSDAIEEAVAAYRAAVAAGDEQQVRAIFARFRDEQLDRFLDALDANGVDVPAVELDPERGAATLAALGVDQPIGQQLMTLVGGSFADFVRARASALGMGTDTIVGHVDEHGDDDLDLDLAYAYVRSALAGEEPELDPTPELIRALAHVLDAPDTVIGAALQS